MHLKLITSLLVISLWACAPAHSTYNAVLDRIMRLAEFRDMEENPASYIEDDRSASRKNWLNSPSDSNLDLSYRDFLGATNQRDEEYLPENTLWGYQFISVLYLRDEELCTLFTFDGYLSSSDEGWSVYQLKRCVNNKQDEGKYPSNRGSGEQHLTPQGKQKTTKQEIKSDKDLPAYCNPPNPCPKGYTERDGCLEKFENTANNNRKYQESQNCPCDADHMFTCPAGSKVINTKSRKATASIGSGVAHALGDQESNEKRQSVVAKKSPLPISPYQDDFADERNNVNEVSLKRIAKKAPYI